MSFGERITRAIIDAETAHNRCVVLPGLGDRLLEYLDEPDRERFLADASEAIRQPVTDLLDAFLYLLPTDCYVKPGWREDQPAFKLVPYELAPWNLK